MDVEDLTAIARSLNSAQLDLLINMAKALRVDIQETVNARSDLMAGGFAEYLGNALRLHHATSKEKFKKKSFEYAFAAAAQHAGHSVRITSQATVAGADLVMDGTVRCSLKTEAAAGLNKNMIMISKFSEARWIRECRTPEEFWRETVTRIARHLHEYDRVFTLRAYDIARNHVRYDLVEIPLELLQRAKTLRPADFSPRTANGSSSATVLDADGRPAFRVRLDGSVEKVTISGLPVAKCMVHASWAIPTIEAEE